MSGEGCALRHQLTSLCFTLDRYNSFACEPYQVYRSWQSSNDYPHGDSILYMLFAAIPIVYEENRGWNTLVGSLPFLAVMVSRTSSLPWTAID